jgi:hypothetical protein
MKKLFLLFAGILLLASHFASAQVPPELNFPTYRQDADAIFSLLDYNKIPTGILYDRVYPIASLQNYNLGLIDTTGYSHFLQSSNELTKASYRPIAIITPDQLSNYNTKAGMGDNMQLRVLNYNFNMIDPDADTNIVYNPNNYVVNGRYSFLQDKSVTITAALAGIAYAANGNVTFNWFDNNNFSNTNNTISYLNIDFGDEQHTTNTLYHNSSISITYESKGSKFLHITTYYTDNSYSTNIVCLYVDGNTFSGSSNFRRVPERMPDIFNTFFSETQTAFQGYDETVASVGKGEESIYLKSSNGGQAIPGAQLTKPIIILDGFDPGDIRKSNDIYNDQLEYNGTHYLGDELTDEGNDLVILNFPEYKIGTNPDCTDIIRDGGADYIERNALVLVKLIKNINQTLIDNGRAEQITVVGPSMGGLISRYALAYMEQNNIPHNCKLWVSFDAPHLGANMDYALTEGAT